MRRFALTFLLATLVACGSDLTGPVADGLPCANDVTPPERFAVPHRYADTAYIRLVLPGDPDDGLVVGFIISGWPESERRCLTLSDSIKIHAPDRSRRMVPSRRLPASSRRPRVQHASSVRVLRS